MEAAIEVKKIPQNQARNQRLLLRLMLYQVSQAQAIKKAVSKPSSARVDMLTTATEVKLKARAGHADLTPPKRLAEKKEIKPMPIRENTETRRREK